MALMETLQDVPAAWPGPQCSVGTLLRRVDPAAAADIAAVLDAKQDGRITAAWQTIIDSIHAEYGIAGLPSAFTFSRHARRICSCGRRP